MPSWLNFSDPTTRWILLGAAGVVALGLVSWIIGRWREARYARSRRQDLYKHADTVRVRQEELGRLAAKIMATSSTSRIAGYEVVRQIEAVFVDGQASPPAAVEHIKAQAARKGGNAVINLRAERLPSGKCVANGDAVIVKPLHGEIDPRKAGGGAKDGPKK